MCVMGLQPEQKAVDSWVVDELDGGSSSHGENGENGEDSSDVSTLASVHGDPSSLLDMMSAVKLLLEGLGEEVTRDGLLKTPLRVAQAFQGATEGYRQAAKDVVGGALFMEPGAGGSHGTGSGGGCGGMVVVRNVELFALCESCLLPFRIRCHIAYVPVGERVVGLSKLPRVAELFAKKLQNPQRFATEVAVSLTEALQPEPLGVAVVVETWHLQWPGAKENGTLSDLENCVGWVPSKASAGTGQFKNKPDDLWDELLALLQLENNNHNHSAEHSDPSSPCNSCPFTPFDATPAPNGYSNGSSNDSLSFLGRDCTVPALPLMVDAVETLLRSIGEDPSRPALRFTSLRFVRWLLTSTQGSRVGTSGNLDLVLGQQGLMLGVWEEEGVTVPATIGEEGISTEFNFPFCSQCEHHLLPFVGVVHVAYLGRKLRGGGSRKQQTLDRESVQRVVRGYSLRLQVQERLTREIAEAIGSSVMVVVEASHMCMLSRGVQQVASLTSTYASLGRFSTNARLRTSFLQLVAKRTHSS